MQKIASILVLTVLLVPSLVGAIEQPPEGIPQPGITTLGGLFDTLETMADWLFAFLMLLALVFLLYAAFLFITAGGDPAKVGQARMMLVWAAVGIVVAVSAKGIIAIAKNIAGL